VAGIFQGDAPDSLLQEQAGRKAQALRAPRADDELIGRPRQGEIVLLAAGLALALILYIPRSIGLLMPLAGGCYVVNSFALILSPPHSSRISPAILFPALIAELSLTVWLLVKGVRGDKWDRHVALALSFSQPP
jgi:hypothetical protein